MSFPNFSDFLIYSEYCTKKDGNWVPSFSDYELQLQWFWEFNREDKGIRWLRPVQGNCARWSHSNICNSSFFIQIIQIFAIYHFASKSFKYLQFIIVHPNYSNICNLSFCIQVIQIFAIYHFSSKLFKYLQFTIFHPSHSNICNL